MPIRFCPFVHWRYRMWQIVSKQNHVTDVVMPRGVDPPEGCAKESPSVIEVRANTRQACDQADALRLKRMLVFRQKSAPRRIVQKLDSHACKRNFKVCCSNAILQPE